MSSAIILKKTGLYVREYDEATDSMRLVKATGPIFLYFQNIIEVEKGVKFENLMDVLMTHEPDIDVMFFGFSRGHQLRPFYQEMKGKPEAKRADLATVEIGWNADYYRSEKRGHPNELFLSVHVVGIAKKKVEGETERRSLTQFGMNDWKHLPIVLSDMLMVNDLQMDKKERKVINLLEARKEMTLYDLIGGVMDIITWYGYPEFRKERMGELESMAFPVEQMPEVTLEEKENELAEAIRLEHYERAAELKKEIENIRKFLLKH